MVRCGGERERYMYIHGRSAYLSGVRIIQS